MPPPTALTRATKPLYKTGPPQSSCGSLSALLAFLCLPLPTAEVSRATLP